MSRKLQIVLPDPQADQLTELAASTGEPQSTLASHFVRNEIARAAKDGRVRAPRQPPSIVNSNNSECARWIEPYGGDQAWRQEMWGDIVALHGRYPRALANLKDDWWTDQQHVETLCALVTWRSEIDDTGQDPRHELAFQTQLNDYTHARSAKKAAASQQPGHPAHPPTSGQVNTPSTRSEACSESYHAIAPLAASQISSAVTSRPKSLQLVRWL